MAARRQARQLPAILAGWRSVVCSRRLQRTGLAHMVVRRCMAVLRRMLAAWRAAVAEQRRRTDELRRCIKRKKVAFQLFKQWYWEAFDADVQVRPAAPGGVGALRVISCPATECSAEWCWAPHAACLGCVRYSPWQAALGKRTYGRVQRV